MYRRFEEAARPKLQDIGYVDRDGFGIRLDPLPFTITTFVRVTEYL